MTVRKSTAFKNLVAGRVSFLTADMGFTGNNLALVDGGAGVDSMTSADNNFITKGFAIGDCFTLGGATTTPANTRWYGPISSLAAGTIQFPTAQVQTAEPLLATTKVYRALGGSFRDIFRYSVIGLYHGSQPASPDLAEDATVLCWITVSHGAYTFGVYTNGLMFDAAAGGAVGIPAGASWDGVCIAAGTIGWGRIYSCFKVDGTTLNAVGADPTYLSPRVDFSVGTSGCDATLSGSTAVVIGTPIALTSFSVPA